MKRTLTILAALVITIACQQEKLQITTRTISEEDCSDCAKVNITIPEVEPGSSQAQNINDEITNYVISIISFSEHQRSASIEEEIKAFKDAYQQSKEEFPDYIIGWETNINGSLSYSSDNIISILFDSYLFSGGAHGYGSMNFLNFDAHSGKSLDHIDLFKNIDEFSRFAEKKFRLQENIPDNENINGTGFMFDNDTFHLPASIGFTSTGLNLIYNPYEIAPYSEGMIMLEIPYSEAEEFLRTR